MFVQENYIEENTDHKLALVIGYGSIGNRHAAILSRLGFAVSVVTAQKIHDYPCYTTIEEALKKNTIDQIIIANPTHLHYETLNNILRLNFQETILVEKPLFSRVEHLENNGKQENIYIAYNLRFHALFQQARHLLQEDELVSFSAQVGSYLPNWRKNTDYRNCYSAKKEWGGGVLRDLSHELDYTLWFCGNCIEVTAMGGHISTLEINSDDVYAILMRCERCPVVSVQLDYLNRAPNRKIVMNTKKHNTILIDLISGELCVNGEVKFQIDDAMNETFITQHRLLMQKNYDLFCNYEQGMTIMHLIEAIELAALEKKWIGL